MKTATFLIYVVCFLFTAYASNVDKKIWYWKLLKKTTNEETKMSRKTDISFYLEASPRTTSSPS